MLRTFSFDGFRGSKKALPGLWNRTYIFGNNGSWKTHILEWIHLLCQWHLTYNPLPLSAGSFFEAGWEEAGIGTKHFSRIRKDRSDEYAIQWKKVTRKKYFEELPFRTVFLSPFDMNLLYLAPSLRRDYIDSILEQKYEQFAGVKRQYDTVVRQRNALLKNVREGISKESELDFWDKAFLDACEYYMRYRDRYFTYIHDHIHLSKTYLKDYDVSLEIITHEATHAFDTEIMSEYLLKNRSRDILTGHTHIGPHRDDFDISVASADFWTWEAKNYLSRGEMKLLLLSLKLLEVNFLEEREDKTVILLIDDIFAELDEENICRFLKSLTPYQTILTSQKPLPNGENWSEFTCINLKDS